MRPFFSFYGGKFRQAARLPEPRYPTIIEPFAGSMGYSTRYGAGRRCIGVDLDERIIGVWEYLHRSTPEDIRALPLIEPQDDLRDLDLPSPARDLIGFWVNKGMTAPCNVPSKWMREYAASKPETFWGAPVRDRIAAQLTEIHHWMFWQGTYWTAPDIEATWLIDPPYQGRAGARYRHGSRGIDYGDLAEWCRSRRGQVIVCERTGADWLPFRPVDYAVKAARGNGAHYSPEAVWMNEEP